MRCPACGSSDSRVLESRPTDDSIRRRRECLNESCGHRFTTYERVEETPLVVIKRDGRRQAFDRNKIILGVLRACHKRPVTIEQIETLVTSVERELRERMEREVQSALIGRMVLERLRDLDEIGWLRFASVYCALEDLEAVRKQIDQLLHDRQQDRS